MKKSMLVAIIVCLLATFGCMPRSNGDEVNSKKAEVGNEIPETLECLNGNLEKIELVLSYDSSEDIIDFTDHQDFFSVAYLFDEAARNELNQAITKAIEWKDIAVGDSVEDMSKVIKDFRETSITSWANKGEGWLPSDFVVSYLFLVMEYNNDTGYFFVMQSQNMDQLNSGNPGMFYVFEIGNTTHELNESVSSERIAAYIAQEKEAESTDEKFQ